MADTDTDTELRADRDISHDAAPNPLTPSTSADLPDIMNDPSFEPVQRRNTVSSTGASDKIDTCRICRSDGTPEEPLFYPCKCSGSIKFVHQECLMEWLSHSHKKYCELCKTPFRFTKLYDAAMPEVLPWTVFVRRAVIHFMLGVTRAARGVLVGAVWLAVLPWMVRFAWRWMFWFADAGWARESFLHQLRQDTLEGSLTQLNETAYSFHGMSARNMTEVVDFAIVHTAAPNGTQPDGAVARDVARDLLRKYIGFYNGLTNTTIGPSNASFVVHDPVPQSDDSVLSSWSYLAELTSNPRINRVILDVFEGQLITAVVITGFILVFLIREWVVQQQPAAHIGELGNVQQQLRQAAEMVQADNERLRRQQQLLDQARRRLEELQTETDAARAEAGVLESISDDAAGEQFIGWEKLEGLIDTATGSLRDEDGGQKPQAGMREVMEQIRLAGHSQASDLENLTEAMSAKMASLPIEERRQWEGVLMEEVEKIGHSKERRRGSPAGPGGEGDGEAQDEEGSMRRPELPHRELSSRATQIQRLLEEAEGVFRVPEAAGPVGHLMRTLQDDAETASAGLVTTPLSSGRQITPAGEQSSLPSEALPTEEEMKPLPVEEMPITNAGPDAKVNIRRSGKGRTRPVPEPKEVTEAEKKKRKLEDEAMKKLEDEINAEDAAAAAAAGDGAPTAESGQGQHGEPRADTNAASVSTSPTAQRERRHSETLSHRVTSAFREEFGLDEADELENNRQLGLDTVDEFSTQDVGQQQIAQAGPPNMLQRVADWFWGDIHVRDEPEQPVPESEERIEGEDQAQQEAPLVHAANGHPIPALEQPADPPAAPAADHNHAHHDPEVLAAAQQAGLDADAVEEAEDLEGVFELVGLQGPLIGLFQTSTFCTVLVAGTVMGAVAAPYLWGKVVLSFIGQPVWWLVQMPLLVASTIADFVVDITLLLGGWAMFVAALAAEFSLSAVAAWLPSLKSSGHWTERITNMAMTTANASLSRLWYMVLTQESLESEVMGWNWSMLGASTDAHASLRYVEGEVAAVLDYTGTSITRVLDAVSYGSVTEIFRSLLEALSKVPALPARISGGIKALEPHMQPLLKSLGLLKTGSFTFTTPPPAPIDSALIYWSANDRSLAVLAGYLSLAAIAAVYVATDTSITRSESGKKTEKFVRDTLRQAGGVLKVILIISIEMLVFPLYCGLLLDIAFLPLFEDSTVSTRWAFAREHSVKFCFMHWFIGTCYMFHFALFVGMCRKILRKGVLWFIRDPDDPTFHPVRDVLERNVVTQLRKIAFSALVYGALVILCLGGVIWGIGKLFKGIFPIHWVSTEPVLEFPMDLLVYNAVTPLLITLFKPSDAVNAMYAWWLRRCARMLRLSHFLFDDRRKEEEGHYTSRHWPSFLLSGNSGLDDQAAEPDREGSSQTHERQKTGGFVRDGKYVLTPCNDQYRPPKSGEAYLHYTPENSPDGGDVFIADAIGIKNDHFAKVYVPPDFRLRISLFMVCLWLFSAFMGLCATLVPLRFGRELFAQLMPESVKVNDVYAYTVGAYILGGALYLSMNGPPFGAWFKDGGRRAHIDLSAWTRPAKRYATQALKCAYVYGFLGVVLPLVFAMVLQFYVILPLHTYVVSVAARNGAQSQEHLASAFTSPGAEMNATAFNSTGPAPLQQDQQAGASTSHTFHLLQDYCLGLLYVRLGTRFVMTMPASRAAEAFRRITAAGYLNPNVRLATRFLVAPATIAAALILLIPPLLAYSAISALQPSGASGSLLDPDVQTKLYRYSYPLTAGLTLLAFCGNQLGKATSRWRARIRDEVYLVGERLHNFGEKKPPPGSKSVVRKDR
ncbi:hypothetical protein B0A50_06234 [Salinomyces thailandicus]|uniref:RING-type E3 ubiquitin transferase n=1 Tax=Salinomyces thailandicus TaxID=706561 RepID=A0A4U0TT10_9PEZI|nr:hypothetical protein B0A50_06234 [Salinomyces thailandica]